MTAVAKLLWSVLDKPLAASNIAADLNPCDNPPGDAHSPNRPDERAISSAAKLPDSPNVQYHLGMVARKLGQMETARAALTKAVSSPQNFPGKDDTRRALAQLK